MKVTSFTSCTTLEGHDLACTSCPPLALCRFRAKAHELEEELTRVRAELAAARSEAAAARADSLALVERLRWG